VHGAIASNVLLSVGEDNQPKGRIETFSTPASLEYGPVPFTVQVQNTGTHLFLPQGTIPITNMFGQKVGKVQLKQMTVLAGSSRSLSNPSTGSNADEIVAWNDPVMVGPYTATLTLTFPDSDVKLVRTSYFWVMPYKPLGAVFLIIVALILIIFRVKQRMNG
jgi:hypothetical protein